MVPMIIFLMMMNWMHILIPLTLINVVLPHFEHLQHISIDVNPNHHAILIQRPLYPKLHSRMNRSWLLHHSCIFRVNTKTINILGWRNSTIETNILVDNLLIINTIDSGKTIRRMMTIHMSHIMTGNATIGSTIKKGKTILALPF